MPTFSAALLLAASVAGSSQALALPRLGRDAAGVVERLDTNGKTFQLRRLQDAKPIVLSWNSRTHFVEGAQFVDFTKLRENARVSVIYHSPFFGKLFVTKVTLGDAAGRTRSDPEQP